MIVLSLGNPGGSSLEGLDLHQVVAPHLQDVHQLLQQAKVKEGLDKKTACQEFWRVWKYYFTIIYLDRVCQLVAVDEDRQGLQPRLIAEQTSVFSNSRKIRRSDGRR